MRAQVNQKLYFARLLLDRAEQADDGADRTALLQATIFHLVVAYRCYLRELSGNDVLSATDARQPLDETAGPELAELMLLERGDSWLSQLFKIWREISEPEPVIPTVSASSGIVVVDVTDALTPALCRQWLQAFQDLLEQQRERSQEW